MGQIGQPASQAPRREGSEEEEDGRGIMSE